MLSPEGPDFYGEQRNRLRTRLEIAGDNALSSEQLSH